MPIQSISTQENEYGVVIHVSVIWYKSLPFDQEKKKKKKRVSLRYLEKVYSNNQHTKSVAKSLSQCPGLLFKLI